MSDEIWLRSLGPSDEVSVDRMLDKLKANSLVVDGFAKPANAAAKNLNDAPPSVNLDAKHRRMGCRTHEMANVQAIFRDEQRRIAS